MENGKNSSLVLLLFMNFRSKVQAAVLLNFFEKQKVYLALMISSVNVRSWFWTI